MDIMPSPGSGFSVIKEYCNLAKHLDVEHEAPSCKDMVPLDQEVPQSRSYLEQGSDFCATDIKMEPSSSEADFYALMNMFDSVPSTTTVISSNNSIISNSSSIESRIPPLTTEFPNFFSPSTDSLSSMPPSMPVPNGLPQHSMVSSSSLSSSSLQTSSSPMLSSTAFSSTPSSSPSLPPSSHVDIPKRSTGASSVKMSSFVSSLSGSGGCVVMSPAQSQPTDYLNGEVFTLPTSTPNFLTNTSPAPGVLTNSNTSPAFGVPEDNLDYLDLDKQPTSFYDDMKIPCDPVKPVVDRQMDSLPLEEAALWMRDVIHHDCDSLKVPYDPMLWTTNNVRTFVSWVCQKNGLSDVSGVAVPMDGRTLCSLKNHEFLSHYGNVGDNLCTELELWKAANSFPEAEYSPSMQSSRVPVVHMSVPQISSLLDPEPMGHPLPYSINSKRSTPCVSPAPSSGSQDSNHGSSLPMEGSSDNSDDEYSSGDSLSFRGPTKVGRGHKQTIHLWQFLRELLLSKENHSDCIRWLDRKAGIFKIEDSKKVAYLWGQRKNRPAMNYDKLSRSVRQYYKKKIIKKTEQSKRLVYQFCPGYL